MGIASDITEVSNLETKGTKTCYRKTNEDSKTNIELVTPTLRSLIDVLQFNSVSQLLTLNHHRWLMRFCTLWEI